MAPLRRTRSGAKTTLSRSTTIDAANEADDTSTPTQKSIAQPSSINPPKIFVLPKDTSSDTRILSHPHPRTSKPSRFLYCPQRGLYEFTKIAAPKTTPRSHLIIPSSQDTSDHNCDDTVIYEAGAAPEGYVMQSADVYIATPFDPLFLLLPVLDPPTIKEASKEPSRRLFCSADDYLDTLSSQSRHLQMLLSKHQVFRNILESRMAAVCDTVDAGDEKMYRISHSKVLTVLFTKAEQIVATGVPPSMEERLVRKELQTPISSLKRGESNLISEMEESLDGLPPDLDSQTSTISSDTVLSAGSDATDVTTEIAARVEIGATPPPIIAPEGIPNLLRLQTVLFYMFQSYVPPHITCSLHEMLGSPNSPVDFGPLAAHLAHLSDLRKQAHMSNDTFTMKRSYEDEEEVAERRAKKARLEEEEKKKKAGMSRGVKLLAKVNTRGMKKMSDFFGKKA